MSDTQRILEKKALHKARALVEMIERDDLRKGKRQARALLIAAVPIALVLLFALGSGLGHPPMDDATKERKSCELDTWNAKAGDFERQMRKDNPDMPYLDVQKRLEHERPLLMAEAKAACNPRTQ